MRNFLINRLHILTAVLAATPPSRGADGPPSVGADADQVVVVNLGPVPNVLDLAPRSAPHRSTPWGATKRRPRMAHLHKAARMAKKRKRRRRRAKG